MISVLESDIKRVNEPVICRIPEIYPATDIMNKKGAHRGLMFSGHAYSENCVTLYIYIWKVAMRDE
jgi:hypothetical protein